MPRSRATRPIVEPESKQVVVEKEDNVLRLKIPVGLAEKVRARKRGRAIPYRPFSIPDFPPGVAPNKASGLAMDAEQTITTPLNWGASAIINSAYAEGQIFLGYAQLSIMAQRPEYRKISETFATESTREWITIKSKSDDDKADKISRLNDLIKNYKVQDLCRKAVEGDGFFGRGHIYIALREPEGDEIEDKEELRHSIGNGRDKISRSKVTKGSLLGFRYVEAIWIYPSDYNSTNPLSKDWYRPRTWHVMGTSLDRTRLLTIVSREVPDIIKPAYSFGGLPLTQMVKPYVDNWLRTRQSVSDLVHSFSVQGIKTNLQSLLAPGGDDLIARLDFFNATRDNHGAMMLDKDTEEWFNVTTPLSTLDALQAQAQEQMASIAGIPIVKLLGIQPQGLNASSEGEIRTFYDGIHALQENILREPLSTIIDFIQLSEWGEIDEDLMFEFNPLWQLDEAGNLGIEKTKTDIDDANVAMGSVSPDEVRERLAKDPKSIYHGLDLSKPAPEPPDDPSLDDPHNENVDVPKPRDPSDRLANVTTKSARQGIGMGDEGIFIKEEVKYESPAKGADHCHGCEHFDKPAACKLVSGEISPEGWCEEFERE